MAWPSSRLLALFAVAAATACSSSGSSDAGSSPTISTFTATPNTLPTAGGSVTLAWAVTGATGLSIDHGVGAVTPVTSGTMSVQVTATTTFTLTATDTSGSSTQTALVTVTAPITVAGGVTDEFGSPLASATVLITSGAFSQSTVSDANGAFSVPNVPVPYDATVLDSTKKLAIQYQGLTRPDPTLFDLTTTTLPQSANLSGQLSGGTFPLTAGYAASVVFASPQTTLQSNGLSVATGGGVSGSVHWAGPSSTTGTLYALELHRDATSGLPLDYPGYGTLSGVQLEDMSVLGGQNIALASVSPSLLSGSITAASGFTLAGKEMFFIPAAGAIFGLLSDADAGSTFSYVTPNVTGATFTLVAEATGPSSETSLVKMTGLAANASGLSLSIPASPTLTLPVSAATGVTVTTPFSWTNFTGVYLVLFSGTPSYVVFTANSTVTIPDFTAQGLPLPASSNYTWEVLGIGPSTTVDSVAVPGGLIGLELLQDGYFSTSEGRGFTTGP
jgi:hypothetical protein